MRSIFCRTKYHQQDTWTFCGPATAQMLLARFGSSTPEQPDLAGESSAPIGSSGTPFQELAKILNGKRPAGFDSTFVANPDVTREDAIRRVVSAILTTRLPVPALVFGSGPHWVLIDGAVIDDAPSESGGFDLRGFYLANPAPVTASLVNGGKLKNEYPGEPLPHGAHDHCGEGGLRGGSRVYVSALAWRDHFWPADEKGAGSFVSITSGHVPSDADLRAAPIERLSPRNAVTSPITSTSAARGAAVTAIQGSGIDQAEAFRDAFARAEAVDAVPYRVVVADKEERWYYVTFSDATGPTAAVLVHADTGQLVSAMTPVSAMVTADEIKAFVLEELADSANVFALPAAAQDLTLKDVVVDDVRFWRPCFESTSPFDPFAMVRVGAKSGYALYRRGLFPELTPTRCAGEQRRPMGFIAYRSPA